MSTSTADAINSPIGRFASRLPRVVSLRGLVLPLLAAFSLGYTVWHVSTSSPVVTATEPVVVPPTNPFAAAVAAVGLVEPQSENIDVAAVVPGTVEEVLVQVGETVAVGDPLFRLDGRLRRAELAVQVARLAEAEATLARWQQMPRPEDLPPSAARVERARSEVTLKADQLRRAQYANAQRAISDQELVQKEQEHKAAVAALAEAEADDARLRSGAWDADLEVAKADVAAARELVEQARIELDRLTVRAPIAGKLLKVDVRPGEYVGTPPGMPLVVLGDVDTLHVRVDIDENDLTRFRPGMPGRGFARGDSSRALPLRFVRVEPMTAPKESLTGAGNERVDTRVLQVIYAIDAEPTATNVYVGQQIDVYLDSTQ